MRTAIIFLSLLCVTANGYFIRSAVDLCSSQEISSAIQAQPLARCGSVFSTLPVLIVTQWFGFFKQQSANSPQKQSDRKASDRQIADFILAGFENSRIEEAVCLVGLAAGAVYSCDEALNSLKFSDKYPPGFIEAGIHGLLCWWCLFIILCARRGFGDYILFRNYIPFLRENRFKDYKITFCGSAPLGTSHSAFNPSIVCFLMLISFGILAYRLAPLSHNSLKPAIEVFMSKTSFFNFP